MRRFTTVKNLVVTDFQRILNPLFVTVDIFSLVVSFFSVWFVHILQLLMHRPKYFCKWCLAWLQVSMKYMIWAQLWYSPCFSTMILKTLYLISHNFIYVNTHNYILLDITTSSLWFVLSIVQVLLNIKNISP